MKIKGIWETGEIWVDDKLLDPANSQKVWNHSPDGFSWSYMGSGCAQLALALLLYAEVNKELAVNRHQLLKDFFVAKLPKGDFETNLYIGKDGTWSAFP